MDEGALRFAFGVWVVLLGATVGSFLNVVIARVPAGESVVHPRSRCPRCRSPIAWYDNVPVVSWLVLRGRCRRCGLPIPFRYVLVELAGAAAAWLAWQRHGVALPAVAELVLVDLLLALAFIDLATWLLPHVLTWPLIAAGLAAAAAGAAPAESLRASAVGAGAGFAAFALVAVVGKLVARKEALGFGDVWLLAGLGAWLGAPALLPVVLLASIQGSVYGLALVVLGKGQPGPEASDAETKPPTATATATATATDTATDTDTDTAPDTDTDTDTPSTSTPSTSTTTTTTTTTSESDRDDEDWIPPRNAVPFGPFLVAGALEWLYLSDWIVALVPALDVFR